MNDTQWPRYQVFVQEQPGGAYFDWGSVHASDGEMALLNARDVFARRPQVTAMWVVPVETIYSRTRQELEQAKGSAPTNGEAEDHAGGDSRISGDATPAEMEPYYVFCKPKAAGTQTLLGTVEAAHPEVALRRAIETYAGGFPQGNDPFAWWVFPARSVIQNDPADADSLFAPALDKPFRLSTDFHVVTDMREVKGKL